MNAPFFLDTNLIMYSLGAPHLLKGSCQRVLEKVKSGAILSVTNTEVLREILHRYFSLEKPEIAEAAYSSLVRLCIHVFPVMLRDTDKALDLLKSYPFITSRDAIHAATMINNGIKQIISTDNHFDFIPAIKRINPGKWP